MTDSEIQSAVNKCTDIFNPDHIVPFPVKDLQDRDDMLLVNIAPYTDDDLSGFITYDNTIDKYKIFVNSNKPQKRVNFTLAHELGHYFLHKDKLRELDFLDKEESLDAEGILYRRDNSGYDLNPELERQANRFAAKLLMPEKYVRKAWDVFHSTEMCALIFDVSVVAMSIRLKELGVVRDE